MSSILIPCPMGSACPTTKNGMHEPGSAILREHQGISKGNASIYSLSGTGDISSDFSESTNIEELTRELEELIDELQSLTKDKKNLPEYDEDRTDCAQLKIELDGRFNYSDIEDIVSGVSEPDGGATWNPHTQLSPNSGFCYSPYPERSRKITPEDVTPKNIAKYMKDNADVFDNDDNAFVGLWNDPKTGDVYLDVSVVTDDASEAREKCKEFDQIAFFDLQCYESVEVDRNAKSGQADGDK